jgi:hypothetical protein
MRLPEDPQAEHFSESKGTLQAWHQKISPFPGSKDLALCDCLWRFDWTLSFADLLEMDFLGLILMECNWSVEGADI